MDHSSLARRVLAEFLGTALLLAAVVGTSLMAHTLSPGDAGLRLLQNSSAVALALAAVIHAFGPVSGAHFNPVVSAADWFLGRRSGTGLTARELAAYIGAQTAGAVAGTALGNLMFDQPAVTVADTARTGGHLLLSEVVATTGLLVLIAALVRTGRGSRGPGAVGAYIAAACWFTASTCFANPAVTLGRVLTAAEAGIAPGSVPGFLLAQLAGLLLACGLIPLLYPRADGTPAGAATGVLGQLLGRWDAHRRQRQRQGARCGDLTGTGPPPDLLVAGHRRLLRRADPPA